MGGFWQEESYTRRDENGNMVTLEEYHRTHQVKGFQRIMTKNDLKLYAICGVGFFIDAYDLFIINLVTPIWQYEYWGGLNGVNYTKTAYPLLLRGAVNAAANIGNVIGQLSFGFLGDAFGRKFVYGKELIVAIVGIILLISAPNSLAKPFPGSTHHIFWYFFGMRLLMGIGIGGDYPMSAAIVAERSTLANRGRMLAWIFSNQGWGTLAASIVTLVLYGCFNDSLNNGDYGKLDGVWRLQFGLALVPCAITLYWRLTMPEGNKFKQSTELSSLNTSVAASVTSVDSIAAEKAMGDHPEDRKASIIIEQQVTEPNNAVRLRTALVYFSEWRHLKILIGTALSWFFVDVAFYGTNLNQSVLLADIGFTSASNEYDLLLKTGYGNLIIAAAGYVPGYFITIALIEVLGRKWIQIQGFLVTALMFGILAGDFNGLHTASRFALFTIAQLFFNFGANATTFIIPGEIYPSRVRGFGHGFSAATGKLGAILSGVLFNWLSQTKSSEYPNGIGIANVLWIFFACNVAGAVVTFLFVPETRGVDADDVDYQELQEKIRQQQGFTK